MEQPHKLTQLYLILSQQKAVKAASKYHSASDEEEGQQNSSGKEMGQLHRWAMNHQSFTAQLKLEACLLLSIFICHCLMEVCSWEQVIYDTALGVYFVVTAVAGILIA